MSLIKVKTKPMKMVSVMLAESLIEWLDGKVESGRFASRSHAIRYCIIHTKHVIDEGVENA